MSTGDAEEVPSSERQLVVFDPAAQKPITWPNNWVPRYWRLGDSLPTYPALDHLPDDLRRYSSFGDWPRRVPTEYIKPQFEELDSILKIRRTLFKHFPASENCDTFSHLIIATLHGEEACTPEFVKPIKPITVTTSQKINFFRTGNYLHRYIPAFEFNTSTEEHRNLCRKLLEASPPRERVRKIRRQLRATGSSPYWNIETGWNQASVTDRTDRGTSGWGGDSRSSRWHTLRQQQRYPNPVFDTRTGEQLE